MLPAAARAALLFGGTVVLVATAAGVVRVLIVPRPPRDGLTTLSMRLVRAAFRAGAGRARHFATVDRVLVLSEPAALVALLVTWMALTVFGFTLLDWGLGAPGVLRAFEEAGSSVFTLGFTRGPGEGSAAVDFVAAGAGLALVALEIAYLPALYASYNRRETLVAQLESRAGAPAWGPELLIRHALVGLAGNVPQLLADWERWAADVAESHTSYPSLVYFRSPRPANSWIVSLLAVLDASALLLALDPEGAPVEARLCLRMGFTCLRDVAAVAGIAHDLDPAPDDPITLERAEFEAAVDRLVAAGFPTSRVAEERWAHFRGWRVNYERVAYALAELVDAPPAPWSGPRRQLRGGSMPPVRPVDRQPRAARPPRTP